MTRISVILPTYNEADSILQVISGVRQALTAAEYDHELVIIDDDSLDGTVDRIRSVYEPSADLKWFVRSKERGLATAVVRGMERATGDVYAVMDADGQHPPERVNNLLYHLEAGADLAVGSRFTDGGRVAHEWPLRRRAISRVADRLSRAFVPQARGLSDPLSGFFAVRSVLVETDLLRPTGYKILLELLAQCPIGRVDEVPYTFERREHGASNLGIREYISFCRHLGWLAVASRIERASYPSGQPVVADGSGGDR